MTVAFIVLAGLLLAAPFINWGVIRFLDKTRHGVVFWHKTFIIWFFVICFVLAITFIVLAVVL